MFRPLSSRAFTTPFSAGRVTPLSAGLLVGCLVLGVAFVLRERAVGAPMLDLALFRRAGFSAGISSGLLSYLVMFGALFAVPFYLESGPAHLSAGSTGLLLTAMPVALGLVAPVAGRAADRVGARPLTVAGMLLSAASLAGLGLTHPTGLAVLPPLVVLGVGLGLFTPANNAAVMAGVPRDHAGVASGVLNMTRGLGTALGLAVSSLALGVVAGSGVRAPSLVASGFTAAALTLAVAAMAAAALSRLRGGGGLQTSSR